MESELHFLKREGRKFWFLDQNFRQHAGTPVTPGEGKNTIPIIIRGLPVPERAMRKKIKKVPIWAVPVPEKSL
jgi:hypothetical protein